MRVSPFPAWREKSRNPRGEGDWQFSARAHRELEKAPYAPELLINVLDSNGLQFDLEIRRGAIFYLAVKPWPRQFCQFLPNPIFQSSMMTMNISLPETLKAFVDRQVAGRGFGTSSEYVRELIRKDQDRQTLRKLLLDGAASVSEAVDDAYFDSLRDRARDRATRCA